MSTSLVLSASAGTGITLLTLNRAEKRNALSVELVQALLAALTAAEADAAQRVLILTGAGPVFCAGLDLAEAAEPARAHQSAELIGQVLRRLSESRLVTIAVVRGAAIAGGAGLMSACDFAFAEETARIGYPETRRGLVAALVMTFLRRQLRERDARRLLLTGELVSGRHAEVIGLVNEALQADQLMPTALHTAAEVLQGGPRGRGSHQTIARPAVAHAVVRRPRSGKGDASGGSPISRNPGGNRRVSGEAPTRVGGGIVTGVKNRE
jgi:methylglutaconyl-CoA hydratase